MRADANLTARVEPPAHCSGVAYDCFHWDFCRAVGYGRLLSTRRKAASAHNCAERQRGSGYISVTVFEWLLVLYVRMGVHKRGVRLRDLVGGRWATPRRAETARGNGANQ
jgi:hypothetical protein